MHTAPANPLDASMVPGQGPGAGTDTDTPTDPIVDLLVIGGGINGTAIARDAAGRGLSVLLVEQDDLASHTSGASSKLIHGGLRYLEYYEFRLVRKALQERERLLRCAPHIVRPMRFIVPHDPATRPAWMLRAGLFLYDHLARRALLPGSNMISLRDHPAGLALQERWTRAFAYSDAWVDDARFVVLNAVDAREHGARIETRTRCISAERRDGLWQVCLQDGTTLATHVRRARALVNAAGPWVAQLLDQTLRQASRHRVRLVKGSHIVVPRLFTHDNAYLFQNPDGRILFAVPYEQDYTALGTTDVELSGPPGEAHINDEEIAYLCSMASRYFKQAVRPQDVLFTWSGVRALLDDEASSAAAVTRDYLLELNQDGAPLLSIFGGKLTTSRKLGEEAVDLLLPCLPAAGARPAWTASAALPGGDIENADFASFFQRLQAAYPWLPHALAERWARAYGTRVHHFLAGLTRLEDLGTPIAPGLYAVELGYLRDQEWARTADDVLRRRSKLGLHLDEVQQQAVADWMATFS